MVWVVCCFGDLLVWCMEVFSDFFVVIVVDMVEDFGVVVVVWGVDDFDILGVIFFDLVCEVVLFIVIVVVGVGDCVVYYVFILGGWSLLFGGGFWYFVWLCDVIGVIDVVDGDS